MNTKNLGFLRVSGASPQLSIGDIDSNLHNILECVKIAESKGSSIVVFPELCLTGYTLGDLIQQKVVISHAKDALLALVNQTRNLNTIIVVGLPLDFKNGIYNVAAVVGHSRIYGFIPKSYIPNYKEFYENRWFQSGLNLRDAEIEIEDFTVPIGTDLLIKLPSPDATLAVELCEDLWMPSPPSTLSALAGATILANLSASNELVGKADYRRQLISQQSARTISGYIYASSGVLESTTDLVFGGHCVISQNGEILKETTRFSRDSQVIVSELDLDQICYDRRKMTHISKTTIESRYRTITVSDLNVPRKAIAKLSRPISRTPFVPTDSKLKTERCSEIFSIQAAGLATRLQKSGIIKLIIGVSGGLDSTLALLVAVEAFRILRLPSKNIHGITMPGFATSRRTKSNAQSLMKALNVSTEEIEIANGVTQSLKDIKHDKRNQDVTFENAQARYRTMILMNRANQIGALVVGTGDLSEIALGWCTFSGDHLSHYNVNCGVPKTLIKYLVDWAANQVQNKKISKLLTDILKTPISPELKKAKGKEISQLTEELIGPYELHDFFLYYFVRWGTEPKKILFLAEQAFESKYKSSELRKWLKVFLTRFFQNQWKRSVMPDGPKVGSVSLSPRGDWRMPSDIQVKMWLDEL